MAYRLIGGKPLPDLTLTNADKDVPRQWRDWDMMN